VSIRKLGSNVISTSVRNLKMLITKIFFREARYDIPLNTVFIKMMKNFFGWFFCLTAISATGYANELEVDWAYISTLSGSNFIEYLCLTGKFDM